MPFIILILSAIAGAVWWWVRNNPRDAIHAAKDVATTIKNAPRRLAFRRQTNAHPVEGIDDHRIAIAVIAQAFVELDDLPTKEQRAMVDVMLRAKLHCTEEEAEEMAILSHWLIEQCKGSSQAIIRVSRRLYKIDGNASWDLVQEILSSLVTGDLSQRQIDGIDDIRMALRK